MPHSIPAKAPLHRRAPIAAAIAVALTLLVAACGVDPTTANAPVARGALHFTVLFQAGGTTTIQDSVFKVRFTITRVSPAPVLVLTDAVQTLARHNGSDSLTATFPLQGSDAQYEIVIKAFTPGSDTLYQIGPIRFGAAQLDATGGVRLVVPDSTILYIGPGSDAVKVVASPRVVNLLSGQTAQFSAQAFGVNNAAIPRALFNWSVVSGGDIASVDNSGTVFAFGKRGTALVVVTVPSALHPRDTVRVNVSLQPAQIQLVSGGNQSATVNTQLANPIVVQVVAQDGVPVPGVVVTFNNTGASPGSATTDANGLAQTRWTLGNNAGTQTLSVSAPNVPALQVQATATVSSSGASLTFVSILPTAITTAGSATIIVQVKGATGQPLSGAQVTFTSNGSGNSFNPITTTTGANGQATTVFSSTVAETKSITATFGSAAAQASLPVVTANSGATQLSKISGDNQTVHYGTAFAQAHTVQALDAAGHPVAGALIDWGTTTGNVRRVTDANGMSSFNYFLLNDPVLYPTGKPLTFVVSLVGTTSTVTFTFFAVP